MVAMYRWCHCWTLAKSGGTNSQSSPWSMMLAIFNTFSFTPELCLVLLEVLETVLARLTFNCGSHGSTSTKSWGFPSLCRKPANRAVRHTSPTWADCMADKPDPSAKIAPAVPCTTTKEGSAATLWREFPGSPTTWTKASHGASGIPSSAKTSGMDLTLSTVLAGGKAMPRPANLTPRRDSRKLCKLEPSGSHPPPWIIKSLHSSCMFVSTCCTSQTIWKTH